MGGRVRATRPHSICLVLVDRLPRPLRMDGGTGGHLTGTAITSKQESGSNERNGL